MDNFVKFPIYSDLDVNLTQKINLIQVILGPRQVGKTTSVRHFLENSYTGRALYKSADAILAPGFNWINELWQEAFELVVGAALSRLPVELFYWREGDLEVDYVVKKGKKIIAIEVKSGRRKNQKGLEAFSKRFPLSKCIFITPENYIAFEEKGLDFLF